MPIKLPKGFQRRKSSGNVLDEVNNPPASSFRVIERPGIKKSYDENITQGDGSATFSHILRSRDSFGADEEDLFSVARQDAGNRKGKVSSRQGLPPLANVNRGSGGTETSGSSGPVNSAASSTRLSTSTTQSSLDSRADRNEQAFKDIPVPPPTSARPGFLRNSARTFSLGIGVRSTKDLSTTPDRPPVPPIHPSNDTTRSRAMTASSASTATPPKLFDSDLALDSAELDGFGDMFDGFGARSSRDLSAYAASSPRALPSSPPSSYPGVAPLRPRNDRIDSSPYSPMSQDSRDGLMRSPSPSKTITQNSPSRPYAAPAPDSPSYSAARVPQSRKPVPPAKNTTYYDTVAPAAPSHIYSTASALRPTVSVASDSTADELDPSLAASYELASKYRETKTNAQQPSSYKKVMTPAQFEQYKRQQEMDRRLGASRDSDSEDGDNYDDDEDDIEKDKQAVTKRKKQEAHLAVYRQQMLKVTGEQAPSRSTSSLGIPLRNGSTPDLNNRLSHMTISTKLSSKSGGEEEEDEDVPLGILAAHGFPNKSRPPTQLSQSTSNPNLRSIAQSQGGAGSVAGDAAKRGSLPVFARHLPTDPYYGASLVNASVRESMSMHAGQAGPGTPSGASTAHPHHPAGLVGVIAGEEQARAMRRGSPNAGGNYDLPPSMQHPGMIRSSTMGAIPGMLTPGDHAQLQMSQQMNQMMQMQMQWMQQMSQMMGGQGMPPMSPQMMPPGMPPNFLPQPGQPLRPQSAHMHSAPNLGQRTMSSLSPSMANWNGASNNNYAQSIAPSERSNVGLASRYRPVSTIEPEPISKRASTFTSSTSRPWSTFDASPKPPLTGLKPSISPVGRRSPLATHDEDDDEQGWAEMKAKKEKKQKSWKQRKGQNALQELYNGVA